MKSLRIKAIILCAGQGRRSGLAYNKVLHYFGNSTCLERCIEAFRAAGINDILPVISPDDEEQIRQLTSLPLCYGGKTRSESVRNALDKIKDCDIVVIHDGARPFVDKEVIKRAVRSASLYGSGIAAIKSTDTIKTAENGIISSHLKRENTYNIQTPQAFDFSVLTSVYDPRKDFTDDSEYYALSGKDVHLVEGAYSNKKITRPEDLFEIPADLDAGIGFDVHETDMGNEVTLGGVKIPCDMRLIGHSDADVVVHSIIDAILSASMMPDIGVMFPDSDNRYLGIDSMILLENVMQKTTKRIRNVSCVIIAQRPKLARYIPTMRQTLAKALKISVNQINISATTTEHLGIVGDGKAIASSAFVLLSD